TASSAGVSHRRHAQWRRSERAPWHQRSPAAAWRNRPRGPAHLASRVAAPGTERLAQALSPNHDLLHWPRESEALVFLEALLRQKPLRTVSWLAYEPGHRLSCRDGWGAAERARFREEAPAPDRGGLEGRQDQVLRTLAGGRQQDRSHGADGIYGTLHGGVVGLRHCRRNPPVGWRHGPR